MSWSYFKAAEETNQEVRKTVKKFRDVLGRFKPLPDFAPMKPIFKPLDIITPNVKAKATLWSNGGNGLLSSLPHSDSLELKPCGICKRTKDQHLLVHCDTCLLHYHLGCLTPPLTRMPKKSKLYGWQCSECDKESSDGEPDHPETENGQRRRRMAAAKAIAATEASQHHDYEDELLFAHHQHQAVLSSLPSTSKAPQSNMEEVQRKLLIDQAISPTKEEKKKKKRLEKELRRQERRRRRKEKKKQRRDKEKELKQEPEDDDDESENDCEIIEQENGQVCAG